MNDSPQNLGTAARANFFHSPQTPSSSLKSYPTIATSYTEPSYFSAKSIKHTSSRKRSRNDSQDIETPDSAAQSPMPLANTHYLLAGGLDTPTAITSQYSIYDTVTPDLAYRRGRPYASHSRNDYFHEHGGDDIQGMPGKDGNGRAPRPVYHPNEPTWGSLVFGLAGKVFNFCTAGTFQGFFSGGGQGYMMQAERPRLQPTLRRQGFEESDWQDIPSAYSVDLDDKEARATKKSKTTHGDTWVMVQHPARAISPHKIQPSQIPRPSSSALCHSGSPTKQHSNASTANIGRSPQRPTATLRRTISTRIASSAGLRSSNTTVNPLQYQSPSTNHRNSSFRCTPTGLHQRRNSLAISPVSTVQTKIRAPLSAGSPALHQGVQTHEQAESPLAKETRKHIDKLHKSELAEDLEIMRMNRQLKDLIKQGKEALGTRIEVDFGEKDDW